MGSPWGKESDSLAGQPKPTPQSIQPNSRALALAASQARNSVLEPKKRPPNPSRFRFEKVNEITWKLTNGEMTNTPASRGQWGGYRTSKAVAWVIDVGVSAWIAPHKDQSTNPSGLKEAKTAALAMAKGACGDYAVTNPIAHLNGLGARLLDAD
jgi:hypothetical protein